MDITRLTYKPGWVFKIAGPENRYLCIYAHTPDSGKPERMRATQHQFRLPDPPVDLAEFHRWVLACLLLCELHEAGEFFRVDGVPPFFPNHQDEGDPYVLVERTEAVNGAQSTDPRADRCGLRAATDLLRRYVSGEGEPDRSAG